MRVGRLYLAALALAIVGVATYAIVPKAKPARPVTEAQIQAMQHAAIARLRFPSDFVRVQKGCSIDRCYLVAKPSTQVVAIMPRLLRADGIEAPAQLRAAEPVAALKLAHWSTASRDPLVIACKTVYSPSRQPIGMCQDAGRIGTTLINVLVAPARGCRHHSCVEPRRTEVVAWAVALPRNS
jgi:hypothetical protein